MMISPFTPLFFIDRKADGIDSEYMQTFAPTDRILLEIFRDADNRLDVSAVIIDETAHVAIDTVHFNTWTMNSDIVLNFATISLAPGIYSVSIFGYGKCEPFRVTDDPRILDGTTLIQYSNRNNRQRNDVVFFIDGMQRFFDWRVPGGFKDANWGFNVESEQFVTPSADIAQLFGVESTTKRFTLGNGSGVPVWYGEMLNRILTCSHVYFDGEKYSRKESNVPELTQPLSGVNSFVFNQTLQKSVNLDPVIEQRNHIIMRRVRLSNYRSISNNFNRIIY